MSSLIKIIKTGQRSCSLENIYLEESKVRRLDRSATTRSFGVKLTVLGFCLWTLLLMCYKVFSIAAKNTQ